MAKLTLFSARACPFAHRSRLALAEKGLDFELVEIDLQNKPAWFNTVSIYGKVPALEHDGQRVVESAIVNEYLDEVFPAPALLPKDPAQRAQARIWIDYANTRFVTAWGGVLRGASEAERATARRDLEAALRHLEAGLASHSGQGPYWFGSDISLVDLTLYPWFERWPALEQLRQAGIPSELTRLNSWREAVRARASVRAIENPTSFYVERYSRYVQPVSAKATGSELLQSTGGALGAVVQDLDVSRPLPAQTILALKQGLLDHHILVFKQQDLSEDQFRAFASYFGSVFAPPSDVPVLASGTGGATPDIVLVANIEGGYTGNGELQAHSDHHWTPSPSAGSLLYALEVPAQGGDTSFYNMHLAYEALDAATKRRVDGLSLITYNPFLVPEGGPRPKYRFEDKPLISPVFPHPLVRTHPNSGKKILFLDASTEVEVVGLPKQEGAELVAELREHLEQPRFRYKHVWSVGDIVYWDNQAVLHARSAFDPSSRRVLKRISLAGSRPF